MGVRTRYDSPPRSTAWVCGRISAEDGPTAAVFDYRQARKETLASVNIRTLRCIALLHNYPDLGAAGDGM